MLIGTLMAAGAINSWTFGKGFVFFILSDGDRDENKKKALEGSAQSTPSNGNQLRRRGRNEIGALAPHHRDFQKKIHFFPFKNEKLNEMGITGRNPIKKRNRIHFFFQINVTRSDCFYFWPPPFAMAPLANGAGRALKTNKKIKKNGQNRFKNLKKKRNGIEFSRNATRSESEILFLSFFLFFILGRRHLQWRHLQMAPAVP